MASQKGRPKSENPKNERLYVRVTKQEKEEIMKFSSEHDCTILDLIKFGIKTIKGQKK